MSTSFQQWQSLQQQTKELAASLMQPTEAILKSVPLYWSNHLKKWINYKEQVLFPQWKNERHILMYIIPTLNRDHELLSIIADRFVFDQSANTYQSFLKIAQQLLNYEEKMLWPKLNDKSFRPSLL